MFGLKFKGYGSLWAKVPVLFLGLSSWASILQINTIGLIRGLKFLGFNSCLSDSGLKNPVNLLG